MLSYSQLQKIVKHSNLAEYHNAINSILDQYNISTPLRICHFLAQILHESGGFIYLKEIWGPTKQQLTYEGRKGLGNTQPGDGKRYLGRGFIMITGRSNYNKYGKKLNLPLSISPELAEKPDVAARIACEFWKDHNLNQLADQDDIKAITKAINGGLIGLADRIKWLNKCKEVLMTNQLNNELKKLNDTVHIKDLSSAQIKELQTLLETHGHDTGGVDGIYGNNTLFAFNQFKEKHNLTHPNFIGVTTVSHLYDFDYQEEKPLEKNPPIAPAEGYSKKTVDWNDFNSPIGQYFTVGELLRYDKRRIPQSNQVKEQILKIVKELDKIREAWGSPIGVTSGYRPPSVNAAVGGVPNSRHIVGDAVDIYPIGQSGIAFEKWLDDRWYGALGYGQRSGKGFTHIDSRNNKGFNTEGSKGPRLELLKTL